MSGLNRGAIVGSGLLATGAGTLLAYERLGRPWCLHWGATEAEVSEALPGDDLVAEPAGVTTRAITIDAPPAAIWPWIVQMGQGRGGAYTYDWIENLLGLGMHSADVILPEFQHPRLGDILLSTPGAEMRIQALEPDRCMVAVSTDSMWSWAFVLAPLDDGHTRFISRNRWPVGTFAQRVGMRIMEPGSLVMERKMLLGIKLRAEQSAGAANPAEPATAAAIERPRVGAASR